jgi:oxygen-dependent protoporphyrinogen oxidase
LLRAFLGGASNPQTIYWPESRLKQAVLAELASLLGVRGQPLYFSVQRWRRAMPQYELGHLDRIVRIERLIEHLPGLAIAGNAYRGPGIGHCIQSGELAAEQVQQHFRLNRETAAHPGARKWSRVDLAAITKLNFTDRIE